MLKKISLKIVAYNLSLSLLLTPIYVQSVKAELITTEMMQKNQEIQDSLSRIDVFLMRSDVKQHLINNDVSLSEVKQRLNNLSDKEITELAKIIDRAPAGADGVGSVIGAAVVIFLVLLITDILGFTKVFPFTRSVR